MMRKNQLGPLEAQLVTGKDTERFSSLCGALRAICTVAHSFWHALTGPFGMNVVLADLYE